MRTRLHVLLAQSTSGTAMDMSHLHLANLKSPGSDILNKRGRWEGNCMSGRYCLLLKF